MTALLLAATLAANPDRSESYASLQAASRALADDMQTGTLLFSRGDCLAVKVYTYSPYTHVAAVVQKEGRAYVYDTTSGAGTCRRTLAAYLKAHRPDVLHVYSPRSRFSSRRARLFEQALQQELDRPYAVKHFVTGRRAEGIHCSEYVTDALMRARLLHAEQPANVPPASLLEGITEARLYRQRVTAHIDDSPDPPERGDNWCQQLWIDTKACTLGCCAQLRRWFLCL